MVRFKGGALAIIFLLIATGAYADSAVYFLDPANFHVGFAPCSPPGPYGSSLAVFGAGDYSQLFNDSLPAGSKITHVKITLPMSRASLFGVGPAVSVDINDARLGTQSVLTAPGNCYSGLATYVFDADFPDGFSSYAPGGVNRFTIGTAGEPSGTVLTGAIRIELTYDIAYEVELEGGDAQTGATTGPLDQPLRARLTTNAVNPKFAEQKVVFTITASPGSGSTLGTDEQATNQTYTATADSQGHVSAVLVLGDKPGTYSVQASSRTSKTGRVVSFSANAVKPGNLVITRGQPDLAAGAAASFVSLFQQAPSFYSLGVDGRGGRIGRIKCGWNVSAKGKGAGAAMLAPTMVATSSVTLTPQAFGKVTLAANPSVSGLQTLKKDLLIGGILVQVASSFDPATPVDDLPQFVPGSDLAGKSLPVPNPADGSVPIQTVVLHLLTDGATRGTVSYKLTNVSSYPGIAMNWPISNAGVGKDLDFGAGAQFTPTLTIDPAGDTKVPIYVYDYGAYGEITATVTIARKTYVVNLTLPDASVNGNRIPDVGWKALADSSSGTLTAIDNTGLDPAADEDDHPLGSGSPSFGSTGDGLSTFEEYRGFVVRGVQRRLNPFRKDLFVVIDDTIKDLDGDILKMPLTFSFLAPGESVGDLNPLINPNRQAVPGATAQHAARVRSRAVPPNILYQGQIVSVFAVGGLQGYTALTTQSIDVIDLDHEPPDAMSPNETLVSEYYPSTFEQGAIVSGDDGLLQTATSGDDIRTQNMSGQDVIYPGSNGSLDSQLCDMDSECDDYTTDVYATSCNDPTSVFLTGKQVTAFRRVTVAHETGHSVDIEHNRTSCTDSIMGTATSFLPPPSRFTDDDVAQIRIHRKH